MSKSLNNIIGLTDEPNEMFGKTMSMPDELISEFLELATDFTIDEKNLIRQRLQEGENPMNIKKQIAVNIISQYHDRNAAANAEQFFTNQFQSKNAEQKVFEPIEISKILKAGETDLAIVDLCSLLKPELSKSAIKRLLDSGAVQIDNQKILSTTKINISNGVKVKIGKRDFFELV